MDSIQLLDTMPLWFVLSATITVAIASVEGGYRLGQYRRRRSDQEKEAPVAAIVASSLGLLAFMLAFVFSLAASRFEARRLIVLEESNAIGTAYLRAGLLPEPHRTEIRRLFREYVDTRLKATDIKATDAAVAKSTELHRALWAQATDVAARDPHSIIASLFIQSLNEVIDLHSKRVMFALRNRIPGDVWMALFILTFLAMGVLGYHQGLAASRRSVAVFALVLGLSLVVWMIADLDRPQEGWLRVSQRAMIDLRNSISQDQSPAASTTP